MTNNLLTIPQAAIARGVSQSRIRYWIKRGWLAVTRKYERALVNECELLAFKPPKVGWPRGVKRCPVCRGALAEGHICDTPRWKRLGVHKWIVGAKIYEYAKGDQRRFTATIYGFGNWRLCVGASTKTLADYAFEKTKIIRDKIDAGDENVFFQPNTWDEIDQQKENEQ